jgi:CBS domain-containing protein
MAPSRSSSLDRVRIGDCIRHGIFECDPGASLSEVAEIMANHRIHALIVAGPGDKPSRIVSDVDLIAAIAVDDGLTAGDVATSEALSASSNSSLREAAQLMSEHGVSHLIARDPASGQPVGVLSTTDILGAYGLAGRSDR